MLEFAQFLPMIRSPVISLAFQGQKANFIFGIRIVSLTPCVGRNRTLCGLISLGKTQLIKRNWYQAINSIMPSTVAAMLT